MLKFCWAKLRNFVWSQSEKEINRMARICMIGAGNVATHLSQALQNAGHEIVQVYSRTADSADSLAQQLGCTFTTELTNITPCDLAIISVKDDVISKVASQLDCPIVHTSGTKSMYILGESAAGVFYPLQTFSKEKEVDFRNIPICLEANNNTLLNLLQEIAKSISNNVHQLSSEQRKYLHLSAVIACNFSNLMYQLASEICAEQNIPFDLLKPLITETSQKIQVVSAQEAQTGPAQRNDVLTIEKQAALLSTDEEKRKIYELLTQSILNRS